MKVVCGCITTSIYDVNLQFYHVFKGLLGCDDFVYIKSLNCHDEETGTR